MPEAVTAENMLEQSEVYIDSAGTRYRVLDLSLMERQRACDRLERFALSFAHLVFRDLYAYGYPSGEQAQMDVERGEAEAESIMASQESAREWIKHTPLYEALKDMAWDPEPEEPSEAATAPPMRQDEQMRVELAELDKAIERTEATLTYLRELRGRLA